MAPLPRWCRRSEREFFGPLGVTGYGPHEPQPPSYFLTLKALGKRLPKFIVGESGRAGPLPVRTVEHV